jgi:hypothetical protein
MKTSTFLIISVIAIFMISLTAYNFTLKASYLKGDYKNPFYGLSFTPLNQTTSLRVNSANNFQIQIIRGKKDGIYFSERAKGHYLYKVENNVLTLDLTPESRKNGFMIYNDDIIIIASKLDTMLLRPNYDSNEFNPYDLTGRVEIRGFTQKSMQLDLGTGSIVSLDSLEIGSLKALIGSTSDKPSELNLQSGKYDAAVFDIPGKGAIKLLNSDIVKTEYRLSKEATVTLNGKALKSFK